MDRSVGSFLGWITDKLHGIAGFVLLAMMLHVTLDVALKYLWNSPIPGTLEVVSYYYMVAAVFLPIGAVEMVRGSVTVDLFFMLMPDPMKIAAMFLVLVLSVLVYSGLAYITWADAIRSFQRSEVVMGPVTVLVWPMRFFLPASFGLGGLACLWTLYQLISNATERRVIIDLHVNDGQD